MWNTEGRVSRTDFSYPVGFGERGQNEATDRSFCIGDCALSARLSASERLDITSPRLRLRCAAPCLSSNLASMHQGAGWLFAACKI